MAAIASLATERNDKPELQSDEKLPQVSLVSNVQKKQIITHLDAPRQQQLVR